MKILSIINGTYIHSSRWIDSIYERGYEQKVFFPEYDYIGNTIPEEKFYFSKHSLKDNFIYKNKFVRYILWARELKAIVADFKPDVIHAQVEEYGIIVALSGVEVPWVFSLMGAGLYVGVRTYKLKEILFKYACKKSNWITLDTYRMREELYSMIPKEKLPKVERIMWGVKTDIWNNGLTTIRKDYNIPEDAFVVLSIRNFIDFNYNISKIIDSIDTTVKKIPNAYFVFIGRDNYEQLYNYARETVKSPRYKFVGLLLDKKYRDMINSSDVVVSIPNSDSISTSVLESLYTKKPVILSDNIKDNLEWVENGKEVEIIPRDSHKLSDAITKIFLNYNHYIRNLEIWIEKNRELIDYEKNLDRIIEVYQSIKK